MAIIYSLLQRPPRFHLPFVLTTYKLYIEQRSSFLTHLARAYHTLSVFSLYTYTSLSLSSKTLLLLCTLCLCLILCSRNTGSSETTHRYKSSLKSYAQQIYFYILYILKWSAEFFQTISPSCSVWGVCTISLMVWVKKPQVRTNDSSMVEDTAHCDIAWLLLRNSCLMYLFSFSQSITLAKLFS